ncbi:MAG: hypothetical protein ACI9P7_000679, partial [Candidatus Azotimanducaceae bacterium]
MSIEQVEENTIFGIEKQHLRVAEPALCNIKQPV